ncbi:MAG: hypothetical protein MUF58_19855 [Arcicella sp.]|jgi:hypothetical protein|nr:hypothetical protein [Arcicella sp.]
MTDIQKEFLYNSIDNFSDFINKIETKQNIQLSDKTKIEFKESTVDLLINGESIGLSIQRFNSIIGELIEENRTSITNDENAKKNQLEDKRRNELTYIIDKTYRIEPEFYENMFFARDIASAQKTYKEKLGMIVKVLRDGGKILLNNETISNLSELENKMKGWYGFESLNKELKY